MAVADRGGRDRRLTRRNENCFARRSVWGSEERTMRSDQEERIRQRAYAIWQSEGHTHGREEEHWQRAEREIAAEEAGSNKAPRRASRPKQAPAEKIRGSESGTQ